MIETAIDRKTEFFSTLFEKYPFFEHTVCIENLQKVPMLNAQSFSL